MKTGKIRIIKTSELAKYFVAPTMAEESEFIFGKVFEDTFTKMLWWRYREFVEDKDLFNEYAKLLKTELQDNNIYLEKFINWGIKGGKALFGELNRIGVNAGLKPKTRFKKVELDDEIIVLAGQPDIVDVENGIVVEFKSVEIDDYAILQSKIFSFVFEKPINLIGLIQKEDDFVSQIMTIETQDNLPVDFVPKEIGKKEDVCLKCYKPVRWCDCYVYDEDFVDTDLPF